MGGLTLAPVLCRNGVRRVVYELDESPEARQQGGMLDLHEATGQAALRAAGCHERFADLILPGGEAMRIVDRTGAVHWADEGDSDRREISRGDLRALLLDPLPPDTVHWAAKATHVRPSGDGRHEITFADGDVVATSILVGADGAWSKVRPLLSAVTPGYTGLSFVELTLADVDTRHPAAAAVVGSGSFLALAEGKGLLAHRESDGGIRVYAAVTVPEDWAATADTGAVRKNSRTGHRNYRP